MYTHAHTYLHTHTHILMQGIVQIHRVLCVCMFVCVREKETDRQTDICVEMWSYYNMCGGRITIFWSCSSPSTSLRLGLSGSDCCAVCSWGGQEYTGRQLVLLSLPSPTTGLQKLTAALNMRPAWQGILPTESSQPLLHIWLFEKIVVVESWNVANWGPKLSWSLFSLLLSHPLPTSRSDLIFCHLAGLDASV